MKQLTNTQVGKVSKAQRISLVFLYFISHHPTLRQLVWRSLRIWLVPVCIMSNAAAASIGVIKATHVFPLLVPTAVALPRC